MYASDLICALLTDFEHAFHVCPNLRFELHSTNLRPLMHATFAGSGGAASIRLSSDLCSRSISSPEEFIFILMIIGHELAHFLNKHNNHKDAHHAETQAIEAWADFVGAKIMMYFLSGPGNVASLFTNTWQLGTRERICIIGRATGKIFETIYRSSYGSKKYCRAENRVAISFCGVLSFLDEYWDHGEVYVERSMNIQHLLYDNENLRHLLEGPIENHLDDAPPSEDILRIHEGISKGKGAITPFMKHHAARYMTTSYIYNKSIREIILSHKHRQALEQGFDLQL